MRPRLIFEGGRLDGTTIRLDCEPEDLPDCLAFSYSNGRSVRLYSYEAIDAQEDELGWVVDYVLVGTSSMTQDGDLEIVLE